MADFNVTAFTKSMSGGGARTNLMMCKVEGKPVTNLSSGAFSYMCKAANVPGSTLTAIEVPYFGRNVKVAGESREFAPLTTTVVNDESMDIYKVMVEWFESFSGAQSNKATKDLFKTRSDYTATITLDMYKKDGEKDQEWKFLNCWPSNMSAIDLSWDTVNTIQEFTIDWQYDYYLHKEAKIASGT